MNIYVLVVLLFTNNIFYGKDAVPTLEFKSEKECVDFAKRMTSDAEVQTKYLCIKKY